MKDLYGTYLDKLNNEDYGIDADYQRWMYKMGNFGDGLEVGGILGFNGNNNPATYLEGWIGKDWGGLANTYRVKRDILNSTDERQLMTDIHFPKGKASFGTTKYNYDDSWYPSHNVNFDLGEGWNLDYYGKKHPYDDWEYNASLRKNFKNGSWDINYNRYGDDNSINFNYERSF